MAEYEVEWLACHAWWPVGWLATAWASPFAGRPLDEYRGRVYLSALVGVLRRGRDPVARWHAARRLGRLWATSPEHRERTWRYVWDRYFEHASDDPRIDMSDALVRFLLGPDPGARHVPPVRLVAATSSSSHGARHAPERVVALSQVAGDPRVRVRLADLLTRTDEPYLLDALERAFVAALTCTPFTETGGRTTNGVAVFPLWEGPDRTPTNLLTVLLGNPHLPRPPDAGGGGQGILAILAALRDRWDLVRRFDQRAMASTLLAYVALRHDDRAPLARETAERILHSLDPGPGRDEICRLAMHVGTGSVAIGVLKQATDLARECGYLPTDPDAVPLYLVMTHQWDRLRDVDPDGRRLRAYGLGTGTGHALHGQIDSLLDVLDEARGIDRAVVTACLPMLGDIRDGPAAQALCRRAEEGSRTALEAVTASGLLPADDGRTPVFLFLTRQWSRYDAVDPEGLRLRRYADALDPHDGERDRLREAARAGLRREPCEPSRPYGATGATRATGYGGSGSGSYVDGGGFSVHGV